MEQVETNPALEDEEQLQVDAAAPPADQAILTEEFLAAEVSPAAAESAGARLKAMLEALVYITDEPLSAVQIAAAVSQPVETVTRLLEEIAAEFGRPEHGLTIREVAGGYKMATKPEHHESIRIFVKNLKPALKLSLAALETLAVVAYKQPITSPEIMEVRGVQGASVLKTLLDRRLIATSGRKQVVGKPILYKTTREFLIQFGLKDLSELPSLKEFEELSRFALADAEPPLQAAGAEAPPAKEAMLENRLEQENTVESFEQPAPQQDPPDQPQPDREPPSEPSPMREPEPTPLPVQDPDPAQPGDPQHEPVKAGN